jgi:hypothetical protein
MSEAGVESIKRRRRSGANELARQPLFIVGTHRQSGYEFRVFLAQRTDSNFIAGDSPSRLARRNAAPLCAKTSADASSAVVKVCESGATMFFAEASA